MRAVVRTCHEWEHHPRSQVLDCGIGAIASDKRKRPSSAAKRQADLSLERPLGGFYSLEALIRAFVTNRSIWTKPAECLSACKQPRHGCQILGPGGKTDWAANQLAANPPTQTQTFEFRVSNLRSAPPTCETYVDSISTPSLGCSGNGCRSTAGHPARRRSVTPSSSTRVHEPSNNRVQLRQTRRDWPDGVVGGGESSTRWTWRPCYIPRRED